MTRIKRNERNFTENKKRYLALLPLIITGVGFALTLYAIFIKGLNREVGAQMFNGVSRVYIDLQIGVVLIVLGIISLLYSTVRNQPKSAPEKNKLILNKTLRIIFKIQRILLYIGVGWWVFWIVVAPDSWAPILSYFLLMPVIPLVLIVVIISIIWFKRVVINNNTPSTAIFITLNWFAFVCLIINVTD